MNESPIKLVQKVDPNGVIEVFEELLARAKLGEFAEAVCFLIQQDGDFSIKHTGTASTIRLTGCLAMLQADVIARSKE